MSAADQLEQMYPHLLDAVASVESGGNPRAVSPKGAQGMYQLMPATAKAYGVDPFDPAQAREAAARNIQEGLKHSGGDIDGALQYFQAGPTAPRGPQNSAYPHLVAQHLQGMLGQGSAPTPVASGGNPFLPDGTPGASSTPLDSPNAPVAAAPPPNPFLPDETTAPAGAHTWTDQQKQQLQQYVGQAKDANDLQAYSRQLSGGTMQINNAQDVLNAYHANHHVGAVIDPQAPPADAPPVDATPDQGLGFLKGLTKPWDNAAVWAEQGLDKIGLAKPLNDLGQSLGMPTTDQSVAEHNDYFKQQAAQGHTPGGWGQLAGSLISGLPIAAATKNPWLAGAAGGALDTDNPNDHMTALRDALIGAAGGKAVHGIVGAASGMLAPQVDDAVRTLGQAGVQMTPGQILGGALRRVEDGATSIPVLGDLVKSAQRRSVEGFSNGAINRSLAPIGQELPAGLSGYDAINHADSAISGAYNNLLPKLTVQADQPFMQNVAKILHGANDLPPDRAQQVNNIVKNSLVSLFDQNGQMSGQTFKAADSKLGQLGRQYSSSIDPEQRQMGSMFRDVQGEFRDMLARGNPEHAPELNAINQGFANLVRVEGAASKTGAVGGVFSPSQLAQAVRQFDSSSRKSASAKGGALMQDLSDAGQQVLPSKVPDSGTPFRALLAGALGAGASGAISAGAIAKTGGAALPLLLYTKLGQKAVQNAALAERPASMKALSAALAKIKAPLAVAGGAATVGATDGR